MFVFQRQLKSVEIAAKLVIVENLRSQHNALSVEMSWVKKCGEDMKIDRNVGMDVGEKNAQGFKFMSDSKFRFNSIGYNLIDCLS